jgi:hypothetical protein
MEEKEIYWQQRGGGWILEGDGNTTFFHLVVHGRRRKKSILSLNHGGREVTDPNQIGDVIYEFYKKLFGSQPRRIVSLGGAWSQQYKLSPVDNEELLKPFTIEEVRETIFEMKEETTPGPDGFGVSFYKTHWMTVKGELMDMVNDFYMGNLDIKRLNYGVITLVPKVTDANDVKQFRPIC